MKKRTISLIITMLLTLSLSPTQLNATGTTTGTGTGTTINTTSNTTTQQNTLQDGYTQITNTTSDVTQTSDTSTNNEVQTFDGNKLPTTDVNTIDASLWQYFTRSFLFEEIKTTTVSYDMNTRTVNRDNNIFPTTYHIDEDGYKGDIPLTQITWNDNIVRNRKEEITRTQEIRVKAGQPIPDIKTILVNDPITDTPTTVVLTKTNQTEMRRENETIFAQDIGFFRWFSNSSTSYPGNDGNIGGSWSNYADAPDDQEDYYGSLFPQYWGSNVFNEYQVQNVWAWDRVYSASELSGTSLDVVSPSGLRIINTGWDCYWNTSANDHYGRGVSQVYNIPTGTQPYIVYIVTYKGTANYEDYVASSTGTAIYKGTLSKKVGVLPVLYDDTDNIKSRLIK